MLDVSARGHIYAVTTSRGTPPTIDELAAALKISREDTKDTLARLTAARVVVLQPESGELLMVPPFSAVPTPFLVETSHFHAYANCAWDALGIAVMLRTRVRVTSACACCGEALELSAGPVTIDPARAVVHFAVPAARWWQDIVFT